MDLPRYNAASLGLVAQLVEQRIENPRVGGSIPPQATKIQADSPGQNPGLFAFLTRFLTVLLVLGCASLRHSALPCAQPERFYPAGLGPCDEFHDCLAVMAPVASKREFLHCKACPASLR